MMYLTQSLSDLSHLAKRNYIPAQQLLGFFNQDFKKAEAFVKDYNTRNLKPKLPGPKDFQSAVGMEQIKFWLLSPFLPPEKVDNIQFSGMFAESMTLLTQSLKLLNQVKQNSDPVSKLEFQNRFEEHIIEINKKLGAPIYPFPERMTQQCERVFSDSFTPANKNPPKSNGGTR